MPGALATMERYRDDSKLSDPQISAVLERVLTATPFTEFDSAYAVRGVVQDDYLTGLYQNRYPGEDNGKINARINDSLCDATILELAMTNTSYSEQFLSFVGGWGSKTPTGDPAKLVAIRCFIHERKALAGNEHFKALGKPLPHVKVLLMTHTSELGATSDNKEWLQYGDSGRCAPKRNKDKNFAPPSTTPVYAVKNALLGKDADGKSLLRTEEVSEYLNGVIGIDTAGPEITCFTGHESNDNQGAGMDDYKRLVQAVYEAARDRRAKGWHGKLLVHTHVGEGGTTYLMQKAAKNKDPFSTFPEVFMNREGEPVHVVQAKKNIKMLIQAVSELKTEFRDIDDFVVFRFGHVTHADLSDAFAMKSLGIEADVNLASNISTRAYYSKDFAERLKKTLNEDEQFKYSDPVKEFLGGADSDRLLDEHPLKHMLEAGVRTMLGSDGGGVEHSDIEHEYDRAGRLIEYWNSQDPDFKRLGLSIDTIRKNAQSHLKNMQEDRRN